MKGFFSSKKKIAVTGAMLAVLIAVGRISLDAAASTTVNVYTAQEGELSSILEINGNVETDKDKEYFADVEAKIADVHVKEGDFVKKGDLILSYDTEELDRQIRLAELAAEADQAGYDSSIQSGNRTAGLLGEAKKNLKVLDQQIADTQEAITRTQNSLLEKKAAVADEGAKLQISLIDWSDKPDSGEYENLLKLIQTNTYNQQYDPDIVRMQKELNTLNEQLTTYKEYKAEMTSQKAATVQGVMTKGAKEQLDAVKEANELRSEEKISKLEAAKKGVRADFDGVVTEIDTPKGSDVSTGSKLLTLASMEDVVVRSNVNRYDIVNIEEGQKAVVNIKNTAYEGKVTRIEKMTRESGSGVGVGVEITLDKPDDAIILGIEAKSKVQTANLTGVLCIPLSALSEEEDGNYVFVRKDDKAIRVPVECGIRNDAMVEISAGLSAGDQVVWNDAQELADGMAIKVSSK
ncbi:MAG: efflux RND transporter periplasmic adaptor subunit [Lachnospiraceae bacterium]|nr:efflux RND transporter periplasmic adaptor subunit [Lachnospiraceae bacterium]